MKSYVVDTNVAVVANNRQSEQADLDCVLACVDALEALVHDGIIVLDESGLILDEYRRHLRQSGEPGLGDKFMKWVYDNQAVAARCEQVSITPVDGSFAEFPPDPDLRQFDHSDRKYVAVALGSRRKPTVLNAVDCDWWEHRRALERNGVHVKCLCPQNMRGDQG